MEIAIMDMSHIHRYLFKLIILFSVYFLLFKIDTNPISQVQTTDYRFASLAILHVLIEFRRIPGSGGDWYVKLYCEEWGRIF